MKNLIDEKGNVYLLNPYGQARRVASIQSGITYSLYKEVSLSSKRVTVYLDKYTDLFFFDKDHMIFHHVQSRAMLPELSKVYLGYFTGDNISAEGFIRYICEEYFVKNIGFNFLKKEGELTP